MRSALVLALVACGSSHPAAHDTPRAAGHDTPAPTHHASTARSDAAPVPACPASFAAASSTACASYAQWCEYPQGDCACTFDVPEHCGGARVPPPKPGTPTVWRCTPTPPEVRGDGCPGTHPNGRACSSEGKVCIYQECCYFKYTCTNGTWTENESACPP
jgi:hypothetical protein